MQGAPKKTSGRSYSQVRPVARHFVCQENSTLLAICKWLKILQEAGAPSVGIAVKPERITRTAPR